MKNNDLRYVAIISFAHTLTDEQRKARIFTRFTLESYTYNAPRRHSNDYLSICATCGHTIAHFARFNLIRAFCMQYAELCISSTTMRR